MSKLTIYKASAGSGKTFTLTRRFLTLLFQDKNNYKHILAATFTNKATEEMKSRVINELYALSTAKKCDHRDFLLEKIPSIKNEINLQESAQTILANILHDYTHFNITTIDSFFQRIIRSFARELRVSSNYNIELDDKEVLRKVSELLFADLDKNEDLVKWITSFAEEQIENGRSWNFNEEILKLSKEFLSEEYKRASSNNNSSLGNINTLKSFLDNITAKQKSIENELKNLAIPTVRIAERYNIAQTEFKYGTGSGINFLYSIAKGEIPKEIGARTIAMTESVEAFYTKNKPKENEIIDACNNGLQDGLIRVYECWKENIMLYNSISMIRSNFYSLGILSDLEKKLKDYTNENNILLLSSSNELISNIIDNSDTPFIYEKTGNRFKHFMIDEFQDTSKLQWENLKPLINNSLSEGKENLIVGDVKQSIYRWRNSDWKLLDNKIKEEFTLQCSEEILPTNWRSSKNVIRFNNTIIKEAVNLLKKSFNSKLNIDSESNISELFDSAYSDIIQQVPDSASNGGYVSFKFYDNEKDTEAWRSNIISQLPAIIEQAQDNGYQLSDIAILTLKKSEGSEVANYLLNYAAENKSSKYKYNIISNEALWISSSYHVKFIMYLFKYLINPCKTYTSQINLIYNNYLSKTDNNSVSEHNTELLPEISKKIEKISSFSLLETTEKIIKEFDLGQNTNEAIFVQSFIDLIHDFEQMQAGSINEFVSWWDEKGSTLSISTPDGQDAINILTIHKSKGLEFKIVIIPFLDWKTNRNSGYLWVNTDVPPLDEIPYLPIHLNKSLSNSLFSKEYTDEILLQYIDTINLLYVAFTRAKDALIVFGDGNAPKSSTSLSLNMGSQILAQAFTHITEENNTNINLSEYWNINEKSFCFGEFPKNKIAQKKQNNNIPLEKYGNNNAIKQPKLRYLSTDFEITDNRIESKSKNIGKIWHKLFEKISTIEDIPTAISNLENQGIISKNATEEISINIANLIEKDPVKTWFLPEAKVRKEATIITPDEKNYRPDRIVEINGEIHIVDFKFGKIEKNSYNKQVLKYAELIQTMGNYKIKGYLWYVNLQKIVEV